MGHTVIQGSLFTTDFLEESINRMPEWSEAEPQAERIEAELLRIFSRFPTDQTPNESQTEDDLIWPILQLFGWTDHLRQQNLAARGRDDVPDGLLFASENDKNRANGFPEEWRRYEFGKAIVESKRWKRPLDRTSGRRGEDTAPSTQMLRYLRRVEDLTTGKLRWGILTNGGRWRLYWQGARSVSEQFFEINLAEILAFASAVPALSERERRHWISVFFLVFRRQAFIAHGADGRTFHERALEEGRFYEERVASSLSDLVFGHVFPELAKAIAIADATATLEEVRESALILLYRLLFILYAEDRDLLPVSDHRYEEYGLRDRVRLDVGARLDRADTFSSTANRYWATIQDLSRAIDQGDASIGLPPYNGGLFDETRTPVLGRIRIGDSVMARVIDALSFERTPDGRKYINYRNLSVQQLGSIYERLLEHEIVQDAEETICIRPNIFARKGSGSYYTPDDLVAVILKETIGPLITAKADAFSAKIVEISGATTPEDRRLAQLKAVDPADAILALKICDPAMGSGHFLVSLIDMLTDQVITAMAEAEASTPAEWGDYVSPLAARIEAIRITIEQNASDRGWIVDSAQLDDRHIVRRMVLKRCVYGVDKNPMAVELAKVALWLHTFTVGAPLSFLDHHLRCGDSLFGPWVRAGIDKATEWGGPLLLHGPITRALRAASKMQIIEGLTDAEIAEAHRSADVFAEVQDMTAALVAFLALIHAFEWLGVRERADKAAIRAFFDGQFGDPVLVARKEAEPSLVREDGRRFAILLEQARTLIAEEGFMSWQVAFPGVWSDWNASGLVGGFDAVIGNPPWDRMKLQQVEWFAARRPEIALQQRAADRKRMIGDLESVGDPLWTDYQKANARAEAANHVAREGGNYPLLSGGDLNLYSLFVERAMSLVKPEGIVGLLTPSGIASDLTAARFFKGVSTEGRLHALFDFENGRPRQEAPPFFPDVHRSFKFCAFIASPTATPNPARCAFFVQDVAELDDPERCFPLSAENFARVNPNTGTAPIFRSRRDASLTTSIYNHAPVLVDRSSGVEVKAWPVKYLRMFDMTNDSGLFRTRDELDGKEGAWPIGGNRFDSAVGRWLPLYVGRMIHQFDHRAASVDVNEENLHNAAFSGSISSAQKADPNFVPTPQYWVPESDLTFPNDTDWLVAFRDIARSTDVRTMIAAAVPKAGFGNKLPLLLPINVPDYKRFGPLMVANLNAVVFDFVARQKIHSTSVNWYLFEQLPVIPPSRFDEVRFGSKSASDIVRECVLELTYTAHDMAPFAIDMGYVDDLGNARPPFEWDDDRRLNLRAKLDAVFFHLYGVIERNDVRYIYSTFPIVERQEMAAFGCYKSRELCLAWMNALAAGNPDAAVVLAA